MDERIFSYHLASGRGIPLASTSKTVERDSYTVRSFISADRISGAAKRNNNSVSNKTNFIYSTPQLEISILVKITSVEIHNKMI